MVLARELSEKTGRYGLDDVVFTGIQEREQSFGQHLRFYVYTLKTEDLPSMVGPSSVVHIVANKIFQTTGIPASGYVENYPDVNVKERPFLITTKALPAKSGTMEARINDITTKVGLYETQYRTTAVNLYFRGHKFAIQTLWSRLLQEAINRTAGMTYEYDSVHAGIMVKIRPDMVQDYLPRWADRATARAAVETLSVNEDMLSKLQLKGVDISLFEPERYVDLDPRVGIDGTAYALSPVRTRMESPARLNLWFLRKGLPDVFQEWYRSHNKLALQFRIEWNGVRLKPNSVHLDVILDKANDNDVERAKSFFVDQGIKTEGQLASLIEGAREGGLARVRPHHLSSDYQRKVSYVVPIRLLIPIITQENWYLFSKIIRVSGGNERIPKLYQSLVKYNSETLACLNHAVAEALSTELRPKLQWDGGETTIEFLRGPLAFHSREPSGMGLAGFQLMRCVLPSVAVRNRDTGLLKWISPSDLYPLVKGEAYADEKLEVISKATAFEKRLRVAIIHPEFRNNSTIQTLLGSNRGPKICEAIVTGNIDIVDPSGARRSQDRSNNDPLKNADRIMQTMYDFFGYTPSNVKAKHYKVEETSLDPSGSPTGYLDKMSEALQDDADLFVVFLPFTKLKYVSDRVYYATYAFAFQHGKPVIHYKPGTWKGRTETYALAYSFLAHATKRFGGAVYSANVNNLWSRVKLPPEYQSVRNPLCVYIDSGPWNDSSVGLITAAGEEFSRSTCHVTLQAESDSELFGRIEDTLQSLIQRGRHDLLLTMRDTGFRQGELARVTDVAEETGVPNLAVSTTRSGGLSAWKFRKGYGRDKLSLTAPYGTALLTPDDAVELFPHNTSLESEDAGGLWRSIRLRKEQAYPATIRVDPDWLAHLGLCLASTADYMSDPTRMKYPGFLARAGRLRDFVLNNVFAQAAQRADAELGTMLSFDSGLID